MISMDETTSNNTIFTDEMPSVILGDQDISPHRPVPGFLSWLVMGAALLAFNFWSLWHAVGIFVAGIVLYVIIGLQGMPKIRARCPACEHIMEGTMDEDTHKIAIRDIGYLEADCAECESVK